MAGNCELYKVLNEICITVEYDDASGKWQPLMYEQKASHSTGEPLVEGGEAAKLEESAKVYTEMKMVGCANY